MSKLMTLVRAGLKSNFGLAVLRHRIFKEKKDRWLVPLVAASLLGVFPMLYALVISIREIYFILEPIRQQRAVLAAGILAGQFLILIFGIYYVLSAFYFSRDLEMLIPLPLRPFEIMLSKFLLVMTQEYLTSAIVVVPVVVTFGVLAKGGSGYWTNSILVYLALPVIPLAVAGALVVTMMRFVNISRKKDILVLIGGIALLAAVFGIQFLTQQADNRSIGSKEVVAFMTSPDGLLHRIGASFPPSIWGTRAIAGGFSREGLANLAKLLGISILILGAMTMFGGRFFFQGLIGLTETDMRKRALTEDEISRQIARGRGAFFAIFIREWRIMNRTPVFLLNGVVNTAILPVLLILLAKSGSAPLGRMAEGMRAAQDSLPVILFAALFMIICSSIHGAAASTFSREGPQFWLSRVIPAEPRKQVAAKFLHCYLVGLLGIVLATVVVAVVFRLNALHLALAGGLAVVAGVLLTAVGMGIDLARPLLDWTDPQKAMKQNLNVLLAMLVDTGILTSAYFGVKAMLKAGAAGEVVLGVLFTVFSGTGALAYFVLLRFADRRYREIEH